MARQARKEGGDNQGGTGGSASKKTNYAVKAGREGGGV